MTDRTCTIEEAKALINARRLYTLEDVKAVEAAAYARVIDDLTEHKKFEDHYAESDPDEIVRMSHRHASRLLVDAIDTIRAIIQPDRQSALEAAISEAKNVREKEILTAIRIMCEAKRGAAFNAVIEDFPEIHAVLDAHDAALVKEFADYAIGIQSSEVMKFVAQDILALCKAKGYKE